MLERQALGPNTAQIILLPLSLAFLLALTTSSKREFCCNSGCSDKRPHLKGWEANCSNKTLTPTNTTHFVFLFKLQSHLVREYTSARALQFTQVNCTSFNSHSLLRRPSQSENKNATGRYLTLQFSPISLLSHSLPLHSYPARDFQSIGHVCLAPNAEENPHA